jgi:hypothetical protein
MRTKLRIERAVSFSVRMGSSREVVVGKVGDDLPMDYTIMRCMTSGSVPQGVKEPVCVYELQGLGRGSRGSVAWFGALV